MAKYKKKLDDDIRCPLEYGLAMFGGKWKLLTLVTTINQLLNRIKYVSMKSSNNYSLSTCPLREEKSFSQRAFSMLNEKQLNFFDFLYLV